MGALTAAEAGRAVRAAGRMTGLRAAERFYRRHGREKLADALRAEAREIAGRLSDAETRLALAEVLRRLAAVASLQPCPGCGRNPAVRGGQCAACDGGGSR